MSDENTATDAPKKTRKPRASHSKLEVLKTKLAKAIKSQESITKIVKRNGDTVVAARSALIQWGKLAEGSDPTATDLAAAVDALIAENFAPPKARVAKEEFVAGQAVKLKADFENVYSMVYSAVERDSMTYGFYDEVSKVAMVPTAERTMAVKLKHIEAK